MNNASSLPHCHSTNNITSVYQNTTTVTGCTTAYGILKLLFHNILCVFYRIFPLAFCHLFPDCLIEWLSNNISSKRNKTTACIWRTLRVVLHDDFPDPFMCILQNIPKPFMFICILPCLSRTVQLSGCWILNTKPITLHIM